MDGLRAQPDYFENGEYKDGAMRFTTTTAQGQPGKLTFFNLGPNKVRQFYEVSADEGKGIRWAMILFM